MVIESLCYVTVVPQVTNDYTMIIPFLYLCLARTTAVDLTAGLSCWVCFIYSGSILMVFAGVDIMLVAH